MATVERRVSHTREQVFRALRDPETYPHWLVGAKDIRDVDADWPSPGSRFHHRVGIGGPLKVADHSEVIAVEEPKRLVLEVRALPFGRAHAAFDLAVDGDGCRVRLEETPQGKAALTRPVTDPLLKRRNDRSLEQLDEYLSGNASHR